MAKASQPATALALLLCAVLAAPWAAASSLGTVEADQFTALGPARVEGALDVLQVSLGGMAPTAHFVLDAARVREVRETAPAIQGAGTLHPTQPQDAQADWTNVHVEGSAARVGQRLLVYPMGIDPVQVTVASRGCLEAVAQAEPAAAPFHQANPNDSLAAAQAGPGIRVEGCGGLAEATLAGDFVVALWEWDASLAADEGRRNLQTGRTPIQGLALGQTAGAYEYAETFLRATDAVLRIPFGGAQLNLGVEASVASSQTLDLFGATGDLLGHHLDAAQVSIDGPVEGHFRLEGDRLASHRLEGTPAKVRIDGQSVRVGDGGAGLWPWLAAVPALALLAWAVRRRADPARQVQRALDCAERGDHAGARRIADAVLRRQPENVRALTLRAYALARSGQPEAALADHAAADRLFPDGQLAALNALEAARVCREAGRDAERERWMRRAWDADPATAIAAASRTDATPAYS